jgi:glycosyltransferase involved in cell wall biosynthesis
VPVRVGNRREINPDKGRGLVALQRISYLFAHRVVANSTAAAARLRREGVSDRTITTIPNGIDFTLYHPRQARRRLRRIVTVANLRPEKAHEVLIEAVAGLSKIFPDVELRIVGAGSRATALQELAARRGLASRVLFLGHQDDVPAILSDADIFALSSRSEAFPNSIMEAMAAGMPLVSTNVGGVPELVDHQRNGVLVPPDSVDAMVAALRDLIEHPDRAAMLGRAARQAIESRFSFGRMVSSFEALYLDLLQRRAPQRVPSTQLMTS